MEKIPKIVKEDAERDFYVNLNKWVNQRLVRVDPDLTARIVSVHKEPGLQAAKNYDESGNVILVSSMSDPTMEWTLHISKDFSKQERYLDLFEKDYFAYRNEIQGSKEAA